MLDNTIYKYVIDDNDLKKEKWVNSSWLPTSKYYILKKYEYIYEENKNRFDLIEEPYYNAPYNNSTLTNNYLGIDREPANLESKDLFIYNDNLSKTEKLLLDDISNLRCEITELSRAKTCFNLLKEPEKYEIAWIQLNGDTEQPPKDFEFLGYDIIYCLDSCFSIINDTMFILSGNVFDDSREFFVHSHSELNEYGLFSFEAEAVDFIKTYAKFEGGYKGDFFIIKCYLKTE